MENKLTITICGVTYNLTTSEDKDYVEHMASGIDEVVTNLVKTGITQNDALLLACLNFLDKYNKSEENADNLRRQITEYATALKSKEKGLDPAGK